MPALRFVLVVALVLPLLWAWPLESAGPPGAIIREINPTSTSRPVSTDAGGFIKALGNQALFLANDTEHGTELWRTDGTTGGTRLLADLSPGPAGISAPPNQAWLQVRDCSSSRSTAPAVCSVLQTVRRLAPDC